MKRWMAKALVQKVISLMPFSHYLNGFFQKYVTRSLNFTDEVLKDKLIHARDHLKYYLRFTGSRESFHVLELGTGWYPVVPVCMFLSGATRICTVDIKRRITRRRTTQVIGKIVEMDQAGELKQFFPRVMDQRMAMLRGLRLSGRKLSCRDLLGRMGIEVFKGDIRRMEISPRLFDLVVSNNTLEHIPVAKMKAIIGKLIRSTRPQGLMSHFIDMSDHYSHFDPSVSIFHFLRYSDRKWQWINNTLQYQNRERIGYYRSLFLEFQLEIMHEEIRVGGTRKDLRTVILDDRFSHLPEEELLISHTHMVCKIP